MTRSLALLLLAPTVAVPAPAQELFRPVRAAVVRDDPQPGVLRSRPVRVRLGRLPGALARDAARGVLPPAGHRLVLPLFDDAVVRARMTRSERQGEWYTWVGSVEGDPLGSVVLSVYGGVLSGSVSSSRGAFRILTRGGAQVVEEIDHGAFPDDNCFREAPASVDGDVPTDAAPAADDGSLIDVLVVYTPAARAAAGGTPAMLSQVNLAIQETNTGYQNSGVLQRLRLVGASEVGYVESGDIGVDLDRVTCPKGQVCNGDVLDPTGYLDEVQALRDSARADLVSLITQTPASPWCGVAWLMGGNSPSFAPYGYSVVERSCMTGYYSFGHELGHNMGLNHARSDPTGTGAYSYSYGYKDPAYAFRTVMAYCCGYPTCAAGCPRVLHFSNPAVSYAGKTTGVSTASPSSAHNALSLDGTRATVAGFRESNQPSVRVTVPNGGEAWATGSPQAVTWTTSALPPGAVVHVGAVSPGGTQYLGTVPAAQGSFAWTVSVPPGASWRVKLCADAAPSKVTRRKRGTPSPACLASDTSDAPFTVSP
jgi:hypothetical protein